MLYRIVLFIVLIFALVACNRDVSIQPNGDGTATITVGLSEAEINTVITNALNNADNPLLRDPSVDLQNGQIVISGEHDRRDGSGRVSGSVTMQVSVVNGEIQAQITSSDIEGWDVSDERIEQFNQQLEERLNGRARENNRNATLDSITITDDTFNIAITVEVQRGNQ